MTESLNAALLELQAALTARSLYPHRHPHIRASEARAHSLLEEMLEQHEQLGVFAIGERVIWDSMVMPSSGSLAEGLWADLRRRGADRLTLRRGLTSDEVRDLLDDLADGERAEEELTSSPHVQVDSIRDEDDPEIAAVRAEVSHPEEMLSTLQDVWQGIYEDGSLDTDALGDIVSSVSRAVADSASAMLPLASLKRHDEYTFIHTINVAILSTALGEAVGIQGAAAHELNISALLHDVGKRSIPKDVLNKNGKFTDEEFQMMQQHPIEGARLLFNTPGVPEVAPIVAFEHHVRADHTGYPKIPRGWKLNFASRIVQVADVFDALRTHRPYRPALSMSEIFDIMYKDAGPFFDADLLGQFFERVVSRKLPTPIEPAG